MKHIFYNDKLSIESKQLKHKKGGKREDIGYEGERMKESEREIRADKDVKK